MVVFSSIATFLAVTGSAPIVSGEDPSFLEARGPSPCAQVWHDVSFDFTGLEASRWHDESFDSELCSG